jgi:hypothetical protein
VKNVMLALMLSFSATACLDEPSAATDDQSATASEGTASQSQAELQVTGHELDPTGPRLNSCFIGAQPCIANVATCHFSCCDRPFVEAGAVRSACGNCIAHANDFCQTNGHGGTYTAWWTP